MDKERADMGLFFKKKNRQEGTEEVSQEKASSLGQAGGLPACRPQDFLYKIKDIFALKEQGCVLVGEVLNGEAVPGMKAAYLDQNGKKIFHCTIDSIEQNGVKMKKAPVCYMGIYGPNFAFLIKDFAPNAFQKENYLYLEAETGIEPTPLQEKFAELRMPWQKKKELKDMLDGDNLEERLNALSIQELACLTSIAGERKPQSDEIQKQEQEEEITEEISKETLKETKAQMLYRMLTDRIKALDSVFLLSDKSTGFPFLNHGLVDIYSQKEYAEMAVLYYQEQFRELEVRELPVSRMDETAVPVDEEGEKKAFRIPAFVLFYYLGMEMVSFDNGFCHIVLKRGDVLPPPDYSNLPNTQIPMINPSLRLKILDFFTEARWRVKYDRRDAILKAKENAMLKEITTAKFLIPMRYDSRPVQTKEYQITFKKDTKLLFAAIKNNAGEIFTPVFTDFTEFAKVYPVKEWGGAVVTIQEVIRINKGKGKGIVINPSGENLILNEQAIEAVQNIQAETAAQTTGTEK